MTKRFCTFSEYLKYSLLILRGGEVGLGLVSYSLWADIPLASPCWYILIGWREEGVVGLGVLGEWCKGWVMEGRGFLVVFSSFLGLISRHSLRAWSVYSY